MSPNKDSTEDWTPEQHVWWEHFIKHIVVGMNKNKVRRLKVSIDKKMVKWVLKHEVEQ